MTGLRYRNFVHNSSLAPGGTRNNPLAGDFEGDFGASPLGEAGLGAEQIYPPDLARLNLV